jgi:hypothetical protein
MSQNEEVDKIILVQLKLIGVDITDNKGNELTSLRDFTKEVLYRSAATCVKSICESMQKPTEEFPEEIPKEMSQTFRVCTNLANLITVRNTRFINK